MNKLVSLGLENKITINNMIIWCYVIYDCFDFFSS